MAKSQRKHTLCTPLSIDQLFIFGIFEHKWGTRKHIDDLKKYSWCIPVQKEIKPIIWGAAITPEPWNRQQCWFIFEDPNVRVARLLESLATIRQMLRVPPRNSSYKQANGKLQVLSLLVVLNLACMQDCTESDFTLISYARSKLVVLWNGAVCPPARPPAYWILTTHSVNYKLSYYSYTLPNSWRW